MSLLIYRYCNKDNKYGRRKSRPLPVRQKIIVSSEIKYLEMLNRDYKELVVRKFEMQKYIRRRSAELVEEMNYYDNKNNISTAIINLKKSL